MNTGIAAATGELVIFLDDEMLPAPDFVREHVAAHAARSNAPIAVTGFSPVTLGRNPSSLERYAAGRFDEFHRRLESASHRSAPTDLNGGNFSVSLAALRGAGGFNESYFFQRNDFELAARLIDRGFEIVFARKARADQRIAVTEQVAVARAEPRAINDVRLAREFPWCVPDLPLGVIFRDRAARARWRALWMIGEVPRFILGSLRRTGVSGVRMVGWEYTSRYVIALRKELGSWNALVGLEKVKPGEG